MSRIKAYIDTDVRTEAKKRIHHIYDIFDTVVVSFSGGKDSLAVLNLTHEVAQERGLEKVKVMFYDEELIPRNVIELVDSYRQMPWIDMIWVCYPLKSVKYILGVNYHYVQWDPSRPWVRPRPEWAMTIPDGDERLFDQYDLSGHIADTLWPKGKVAILTGIRASESLIRLRSCVEKLNENYITASQNPKPGSRPHPRLMLCKPIFDWEENDVFRFFYEEGIPYAAIYDQQIWNRQALRVSTPLHAEAAKRFDKLRAQDPELYEAIIRIFPEMQVQERYYKDLNKTRLLDSYGQDGWDGIYRYIQENIHDPAQNALAMNRIQAAQGRARRRPDAYPIHYVLKQVINGAFKRQILPLKR
jgi:predicted phosphoadenosine phosphosulfate sulfurtransferase